MKGKLGDAVDVAERPNDRGGSSRNLYLHMIDSKHLLPRQHHCLHLFFVYDCMVGIVAKGLCLFINTDIIVDS